jgi:hypothetical protein
MELPGATYLYTLATLAVSFVGFSALVMILRQTFGGEVSKLDTLITRIFIQLGFIVAGGALLPSLLSLFQLPHDLIWRLSSVATATPAFLFAVTYQARRRAASGVGTPIVVWIDVLVLALAAVVLIANAVGLGFPPAVGPFAGALTAILFLSFWAYLQALKMLLHHHFRSNNLR